MLNIYVPFNQCFAPKSVCISQQKSMHCKYFLFILVSSGACPFSSKRTIVLQSCTYIARCTCSLYRHWACFNLAVMALNQQWTEFHRGYFWIFLEWLEFLSLLTAVVSLSRHTDYRTFSYVSGEPWRCVWCWGSTNCPCLPQHSTKSLCLCPDCPADSAEFKEGL